MIRVPPLPDEFPTWSPAEQRAFALGCNFGSAARAVALVDAMWNAAHKPEVETLGARLAILTLAKAFDQDIGVLEFVGDESK